MGLIWNYFLLDAISTASGCSSTWHSKGQLLTSCLTWKSLWMDSLMVKTAILEVLVSGVSVGLHLSQNNTDNCLYRTYSLLRCLIIINITNVILCCKCQMSRLALSNPKDPLMAPRLETFSAASGQKSRSLKCFETNTRMKEKWISFISCFTKKKFLRSCDLGSILIFQDIFVPNQFFFSWWDLTKFVNLETTFVVCAWN